jgi:hypothetical protein
MKRPKAYAVILQASLPKELLSVLDEYLMPPAGGLLYVIAAQVSPGPYFVELEMLRTRDREPWLVQIPLGYVLAIAQMSEPTAGPGFLRP